MQPMSSPSHNLGGGITVQPPLRVDGSGVIRFVHSRVTLDPVISEYEKGMDADEIVRAYDTLNKADVNAAIAFYHRYPAEVSDYIRRGEEEADRLRALIEAERPPALTKAELL